MEATRIEAASTRLDEDIETWQYILGPTPCWVDFMLSNVYIVQVYMFGKALVDEALLATEAYGVIAAYTATLDRPHVKEYLATAEQVLYSKVSAENLGLPP